MILQGAIAWLGLMFLAIANGTLREFLLTPRLGARLGHVLSTLLLCVLIFLVAWLVTPWIGARQPADTWRLGTLWLVLTLAFEFIVGHYVFGNSWQNLLADYDLLHGRIWLLVPIITFIGPRLALAMPRP